jgi:hypothetical protein
MNVNKENIMKYFVLLLNITSPEPMITDHFFEYSGQNMDTVVYTAYGNFDISQIKGIFSFGDMWTDSFQLHFYKDGDLIASTHPLEAGPLVHFYQPLNIKFRGKLEVRLTISRVSTCKNVYIKATLSNDMIESHNIITTDGTGLITGTEDITQWQPRELISPAYPNPSQKDIYIKYCTYGQPYIKHVVITVDGQVQVDSVHAPGLYRTQIRHKGAGIYKVEYSIGDNKGMGFIKFE